LRPLPYAEGDLELLLTLQDADGATYYLEGTVARQSGALLAHGELVAADDPAGVSSWSAGDPSAVARLPATYNVAIQITNQYGMPGGPTLAALLDGQLQGTSAPPLLGESGEPLSLFVIGTQPLVSGQPTYSLDFGDGSPPAETQSQTITHTYAAPGVYTVFASMIDGAGSRRFGVAQYAIGPAAGS
jgi:hypothetical protein